MSNNRTSWGWTSSGLRAPHQADVPRARWHLLRPLMQLLLTSAAPSNIGQGGDTIIQTLFCVSPCAWVKLIFAVSRIKRVIFAQGRCSLRHTTRFARVILEQGAMCSSRDDPICVCHPCASHISASFKKKTDYPSQIIRVILMQGPCSSIQSHAIFVQGP